MRLVSVLLALALWGCGATHKRCPPEGCDPSDRSRQGSTDEESPGTNEGEGTAGSGGGSGMMPSPVPEAP